MTPLRTIREEELLSHLGWWCQIYPVFSRVYDFVPRKWGQHPGCLAAHSAIGKQLHVADSNRVASKTTPYPYGTNIRKIMSGNITAYSQTYFSIILQPLIVVQG